MIKFVTSSTFKPLMLDEHRYLVLCGGRGSGKSEFAARKLLWRCVFESDHRFLVLRKVRARCRESVLEVFRRLLLQNGIKFDETKTERTLKFLGNEILFDGLDDPEKIKSIKAVTGIWIEEATEFTEHDFLGVDLILREPGPKYHQIIMSFNPDEAVAPWLKKRFFDHQDADALVHVSTIEDNPIDSVRAAYKERLDKINDETYRAIYRFGRWAQAKGVIYNWPVVPLPGDVAFDEIFYGLDFGYSVDPAAVVRVYRRADSYWLEEVIYQTGLTNRMLGALMRERGVGSRQTIFYDSAEPKSGAELKEMGFCVIPAEKGPDSVRAGIDFVKSQKVHIVAGSENIIRECRRYKWREDRAGNVLPVPVNFENHSMDATRYAIAGRGLVKRPTIRRLFDSDSRMEA